MENKIKEYRSYLVIEQCPEDLLSMYDLITSAHKKDANLGLEIFQNNVDLRVRWGEMVKHINKKYYKKN